MNEGRTWEPRWLSGAILIHASQGLAAGWRSNKRRMSRYMSHQTGYHGRATVLYRLGGGTICGQRKTRNTRQYYDVLQYLDVKRGKLTRRLPPFQLSLQFRAGSLSVGVTLGAHIRCKWPK